jgi:serine/threonine-protein kinase
MRSKVVIKITRGQGLGKSYEYTGHETLFIGRAEDCGIVLRDDTVSRYHCMVEIQPPFVYFHDFGSLNGTYLNGKLKAEGRALTGLDIEEARGQEPVIFPVHSGDRLGLSTKTELEIIVIKPRCADCGAELEDGGEDVYKNDAGGEICRACHEKLLREKEKNRFQETMREIAAHTRAEELAPKATTSAKTCMICGNPLEGAARGGARICGKCRDNSQAVLEHIFREAAGGKAAFAGLSGYRKVRQLGRGGMGAVWLVEEEKTGKKAAMKVILPDMAANESSRALFLREAMLGQQLTHENIIRQYTCGSDGDTFFILQEACLGGSVDNFIERMDECKLPVEIATDITLQVLLGLAYAHTASVTSVVDGVPEAFTGVVHRDIKPANFFIAEEFPTEKFFDVDGASGKLILRSFRAAAYRAEASLRPKIRVADFGLAKAFESAGLTNFSGKEAKGTPVFMPRQQITQCKYAMPNVDVWAAAASYYNMLTGQFPKPVRSPRTAWQDVLRNSAIPIREREPSLDKGLAELIDRALIDNPDIIFQSAAELKKAIEEAL